ncbi:hypothetical protein SALBM311S_06350 [Streptomyces alboniger]
MNQGDRHRFDGHGLHLVHAISDRVVLASRALEMQRVCPAPQGPGGRPSSHLRVTQRRKG